MRAFALFALALPTALALACGGGTPAAETPATAASSSASASPSESATPAATVSSVTPSASGSAAPTASAAPAAGPRFGDLKGKDAQVAFMKANVMPAMAKVFKEHDAKEFADFGCKTCHGAGVAPQKHLPKLKLMGKGDMEKLMKDKPADFKFMHEVVEPTMAKAMGEQPFDMKTMTGFGCKGCHTVE